MPKAAVPFPFLFENLSPINVTVKSFFGCHAICVDDKILLAMRQKKEYVRDNGVWIATAPEHHASLRTVFPSMRSIELFGDPPSSWQNLPLDSDDFEESVNILCRLILKSDPRIGRIPKKRARKGVKH
jgi:hypothetical protein